MPESPTQNFVITCGVPNPASKALGDLLSEFGPTTIVCGVENENNNWYPNDSFEGFIGVSKFPPDRCALTKALRWLEEKGVNRDENYWFVEDDVAFPPKVFEDFLERNRELNPDFAGIDYRTVKDFPKWPQWYHFHKDVFKNSFLEVRGSFIPLFSIKGWLLEKAFEFRRKHNCYMFLECMFPALAREHNASVLEWKNDKLTLPCFTEYSVRPPIIREWNGICHPVKDPQVVKAICEIKE